MAAVAAGAMATETVDVTAGKFLLKELKRGSNRSGCSPFFSTIQLTCRVPLRIPSGLVRQLMCLQTHEAGLSR